MSLIKLALIQQTASEDRQANLERGLKAAHEAADQGANVICFAELAFEPFYPQDQAQSGFESFAETIPGPITESFSSLAKEREVVIAPNLFERTEVDGKLLTFDSSPVIDADGSLLGITRMIHITDYDCFHEKGYYVPGDRGAPVYQTRFGKIGIAICYDRHFPEYLRALAVSGAELVIVPQAGAVDEWPDGLYQAEIRVASFQNGYFTALCNRVGKEPKLTFAGESFVCNPAGEIVAQAGLETEEILYTEIDLSEVEKSYARRLFMPDRRPELYSNWLGAKE